MSYVTTSLDPCDNSSSLALWHPYNAVLILLYIPTSLPCLRHELPSFQASTLGGIVPVDMCKLSELSVTSPTFLLQQDASGPNVNDS